MEPATPLVSIGIPVYNGARYLEEALDSILAQTWQNFEIIISDNASTDETQAICEAYAARDSRIRYYHHEKNLGASRNFNRTFELAQGKYFKWAAHDDRLAPDFLRCCVDVLERRPEVVLCYSATRVIDEQGEWVEDYEEAFRTDAARPHVRLYELLWKSNRAYEVFGLIRRDVLAQTPLIGPYAASDRVLLAALALHGTFYRLSEPLFISRKHPRSSVRSYSSPHKRAAWFDTSKQGRLVFPAWEMFFGFAGTLRAAALPRHDRLACGRLLAQWTWHRRSLMLRDVITALKYIVLLFTLPTPAEVREAQAAGMQGGIASVVGAYALKWRLWRLLAPSMVLFILLTGLVMNSLSRTKARRKPQEAGQI